MIVDAIKTPIATPAVATAININTLSIILRFYRPAGNKKPAIIQGFSKPVYETFRVA